MSTLNRTYLLILFSYVFSQSVFAQGYKWDTGLFIGGTIYQGDLVQGEYYDFEEFNFGFGIVARHHIYSVLSIRGNLLFGQISGNDSNYESRKDRAFSLNAPITEFSLLFEVEPLGFLRYKNKEYKRLISPYFFGGLGFASSRDGTNYNEEFTNASLDKINLDKMAGVDNSWFAIPFGFGIKADVIPQWVVSAEWGFRPVFDDLLDGISQTGNPDQSDWYAAGGATISYQFGSGDRDGDGIRDIKDRCPDIPASPATNGCPDQDFDNIPDDVDMCPETPGIREFSGCPDSDGDNIPDDSDLCPDVIGRLEYQGCPYLDSDLDSIPDVSDNCPDLPGPPELFGCPDTDGDKIIDPRDECPNEAGPEKFNGCPDSDNDEVIDKKDRCPTEPGEIVFAGCPDTDKDSIPDFEDRCPELAGQKDNWGCPEISEKDIQTLNLASKQIYFETGRSAIKPSSHPVLDEIGKILLKYQNYDIRIEGYTDNRGNDMVNQQISEKRARECVKYLEDFGIKKERLKAKGYGETNPIADNKSAEGRARNRRVEFHLEKRQ